MKRSLVVPVVLSLSLLAPLAATEVPSAASFEKIKSLAGEWRGVSGKGKKVRLSYETIAGGTAVLETFGWEGSEQTMSTVYHLDGDRLVLTHYCVSNNQPRMQAQAGGEPGVLRFEFLDATNLKSSADGHMHKALLRIHDQDHIGNAWTYFQDGKEAFTESGEYERIRK